MLFASVEHSLGRIPGLGAIAVLISSCAQRNSVRRLDGERFEPDLPIDSQLDRKEWHEEAECKEPRDDGSDGDAKDKE